MAKDAEQVKQDVVEKVEAEVVSKAEYDKVVAERDKYAEAVTRLINTMAQRYANDLARDVLSDPEQK